MRGGSRLTSGLRELRSGARGAGRIDHGQSGQHRQNVDQGDDTDAIDVLIMGLLRVGLVDALAIDYLIILYQNNAGVFTSHQPSMSWIEMIYIKWIVATTAIAVIILFTINWSRGCSRKTEAIDKVSGEKVYLLKEAEGFRIAEWILAIATIALTAATIYIAKYTGRLLEEAQSATIVAQDNATKQLAEAHAATTAAVNNANLQIAEAQKANKLAEESVLVLNRAYIFPKLSDGVIAANPFAFSRVLVMNDGLTPAKNLTIKCGISEQPGSVPSLDRSKAGVPPDSDDRSSAFLGSKDFIEIRQSIPLEVFKRVSSGISSLFLLGEAHYTDIFGHNHNTYFSYKVLVDSVPGSIDKFLVRFQVSPRDNTFD